MALLHAAGNVLSDWFDYRRGIDNKDAYAVPNLVFGHFQPKEYAVALTALYSFFKYHALGDAEGNLEPSL